MATDNLTVMISKILSRLQTRLLKDYEFQNRLRPLCPLFEHGHELTEQTESMLTRCASVNYGVNTKFLQALHTFKLEWQRCTVDTQACRT